LSADQFGSGGRIGSEDWMNKWVVQPFAGECEFSVNILRYNAGSWKPLVMHVCWTVSINTSRAILWAISLQFVEYLNSNL
jgi:hypothetical protein